MTTTVIQGTLLLAMRWKLFGASPSFDMPYIMRPAPKISLLIAEMLALITMIQYVFSFIGIVVFSVLTAYDSQTYKVMYYQYGSQVNTDSLAAVGALNLYLDFLNIFLYLLQIFGIGSSDND